jgi:hypothetical protein
MNMSDSAEGLERIAAQVVVIALPATLPSDVNGQEAFMILPHRTLLDREPAGEVLMPTNTSGDLRGRSCAARLRP